MLLQLPTQMFQSGMLQRGKIDAHRFFEQTGSSQFL
jgi:hypothetical protein